MESVSDLTVELRGSLLGHRHDFAAIIQRPTGDGSMR